jgi:hypothetical protein
MLCADTSIVLKWERQCSVAPLGGLTRQIEEYSSRKYVHWFSYEGLPIRFEASFQLDALVNMRWANPLTVSQGLARYCKGTMISAHGKTRSSRTQMLLQTWRSKYPALSLPETAPFGFANHQSRARRLPPKGDSVCDDENVSSVLQCSIEETLLHIAGLGQVLKYT